MRQKLFVVRHGQTLWNQEFRLQGRLDSALTELGKRQADENGRLLKRYGVQRLLVSPLGRTTETAHIINSHVRGDVEFCDDLVERDSGRWSGLTLDDIRRTQPASWRTRQADEWSHRPPDGENIPDVIARIAPLLDRLLCVSHKKPRQQTTGSSPVTAIISHGVVGKAILAHALALDPRAGAQIRQPNDVVYALSFGPAEEAADDAAENTVACEHFKGGEGPFSGVVSSPFANPGGQSGQ